MGEYKKLEISNFKGIKQLNIDDLSRVNVFLGQNNSGKSTILEALTLAMSVSNPDMPQLLNAFRARKAFSNFIDIRYFWHNLDLNNAPEITLSQNDSVKRHLKLGLSYVFDEEAEPQTESTFQLSGTIAYVNTLEMNFDIITDNSNQSYKSWLRINPSGMVVKRKIADGYLEKNSYSLISPDLTSSNLVNDLTELFKRNQKNIVVNLLALFDIRISGIEILKDDVYIKFEGIPEMLPLSLAGDGLRRYLNIVASSANPMTNIILIDEIDNGLHYSAYKKLWDAIFALAISTNKQVFVTTHSKETLYRLNEMLEEHSEYQDALRLYTLEKTKLEGHQAYKYTYEGLAEACRNNVELRSIVL